MRTTLWCGLGVLMLAACGDATAKPPSSVGASTTTAAAATTTAVTRTTEAATTTSSGATAAKHFTHAQLAAGLPTAAQLGWLPTDATATDDYDLTSTLRSRTCGGAPERVRSNEAAATSRAFQSASEPGVDGSMASVTLYDVDDAAGATTYVRALRGLTTCPPPSTMDVTIDVLPSAESACADSLVVLQHQQVGVTIDGWCRVGNLIGWFRLYPTAKAPTAAQADRTLAAVGERLAALLTG